MNVKFSSLWRYFMSIVIVLFFLIMSSAYAMSPGACPEYDHARLARCCIYKQGTVIDEFIVRGTPTDVKKENCRREALVKIKKRITEERKEAEDKQVNYKPGIYQIGMQICRMPLGKSDKCVLYDFWVVDEKVDVGLEVR